MSSTTLEKLDRALGQIDRPGTFCVTGRVPAVLPGLEVDELGPVGLPMTARAARDLIKHCQQAPYGKGEQTLVDTKVRRVWRMAPDHFRLRNPEWGRIIEGIVSRVQEELGLEGQKLESHLYDLLLYEKGGFFLPHRDGEKLDRMVATLVVVLPASHEGGELIVRHDGNERTIDFGSPSGDEFHIQYAAFYADCEHEVRPLKKGHRLCLIYNLTLAGAKKAPKAPRDSDALAKIAPLVREWAEGEEAGEKLGILLDHQYTEGGLSWDALKGTDRVKARVLAEAARQSGCRAHLARVTLHESGEGEDVGGHRGYGYGRGRWQRRQDDDDEAEEAGGGRYRMVEVFETELTADHWSDPEGHRLPIGEVTIAEDELLDPKSLTAIPPDEDFQGYTGNEGSPLNRWYRHAAIFLWPEHRHFQVVCSRDSRAIVPELSGMVSQWKAARGDDAEPLAARCRQLAAAIIARWPAGVPVRSKAGSDSAPSPASRLIESLEALDAPDLIVEFLGGPLIADAGAEPGDSIVAVGRKYGWPILRSPLGSAMKGTTPDTAVRNVRLLESICTARPGKKAGWRELGSALSDELISAIVRIDRDDSGMDWRYRPIDRAEILAGLARSLIATDQSERMSQFIDHTLALSKKYPLTEVQIKAIIGLRSWLGEHVDRPFPALSKWLDAIRKQLEALTAREPREPADLRRAAPLTCACSLCAELKQFLEDPREAEHRFRVRKELRHHLHVQIDNHRIDLTHVTDRRGSPQTLVCTKTTASYQASVKKYQSDREHLATIEAIRASLPG